MAGKGKWILAACLAAVIIIALIQNRDTVNFSFLIWKVVVSKVILIPAVLLIGFGLGYFAGRYGKK